MTPHDTRTWWLYRDRLGGRVGEWQVAPEAVPELAQAFGREAVEVAPVQSEGERDDELCEALLATNRALGGALLILRSVRDGEPVGSRPERVARECEVAQERYFATRDLLAAHHTGGKD